MNAFHDKNSKLYKKQASAVELFMLQEFNLFHYVNASCTAFCVVRKQLED